MVIQQPLDAITRFGQSLFAEAARLRFTGDAGRTYRLQRDSDPAGPWITFAALVAP
jgi:hypothetical protein